MIFMKFDMEVIWVLSAHTCSSRFGDAATRIPSFIGSKVILFWMDCVCYVDQITQQISSKFYMKCILPLVFIIYTQMLYNHTNISFLKGFDVPLPFFLPLLFFL